MAGVGDRLYPPPTVVGELRCQCKRAVQERQSVDSCFLCDFTHIAVGVADHAAFVVEGIDPAVLVVMVYGCQGILVAHAVKAVGVVVIRGGFGLLLVVLRPALAVGGQVASIIGEGFGKLTLLICQSSAQQVIRVVALPVVGL